jgi:hypothetical protein
MNQNPPFFENSEESTLEPLVPAYSTFKTPFATVSLYHTDRIRLPEFPHTNIAAIREVANASWQNSIQAEQTYDPSFEFKLHENRGWARLTMP